MGQACLRCSAALPERARLCPDCAYEQSLGAPAPDSGTRSAAPAATAASKSEERRTRTPPPPALSATLPSQRVRAGNLRTPASGPRVAAESPTMLHGAPVALTHLLQPG